MQRTISQIAKEISREWKKPYFCAVPYLVAMRGLESVSDNYGADSAKSVVLYFLSNASSYRGPVAKAHKAELKAIAGVK